MRSINEVKVSGKLTRANLHSFDSGSRTVNAQIIVDRSARKSDWIEIKGWDEIADAFEKHATEDGIKSGIAAFVTGRLQADVSGPEGDRKKFVYVQIQHLRLVDEKTGETLADVEAKTREEREAEATV